jgi:hypothetical protein
LRHLSAKLPSDRISSEWEPSIGEVTTIGLDLAKHVFQVHGVDAEGATVLRKQLRRAQVLAFFSRLPPCLVSLEACAMAHYWARTCALSRSSCARSFPSRFSSASWQGTRTGGDVDLHSLSVVFQQLPRVNPEALSDTGDIVDGHIPLGSLDSAEICPVNPALVREGFLAKTTRGTEPTHVLS